MKHRGSAKNKIYGIGWRKPSTVEISKRATTLLDSTGASGSGPGGFDTLRRRLTELRNSQVLARATELAEQADGLRAKGSLDGAIELCREVLELVPGHPQASQLLEEVEAQQERTRRAERIDEAAAGVESLMQTGDLDAAEKALRNALEAHGAVNGLGGFGPRLAELRRLREERDEREKERQLVAERQLAETAPGRAIEPETTSASHSLQDPVGWIRKNAKVVTLALAILVVGGVTLVMLRGGGRDGPARSSRETDPSMTAERAAAGEAELVEGQRDETDSVAEIPNESAITSPSSTQAVEEISESLAEPNDESPAIPAVPEEDPPPVPVERNDSRLASLFDESRSLLAKSELQRASRLAESAELMAPDDPGVQSLWLEIAGLARRRAEEAKSEASLVDAEGLAPDSWLQAEASMGAARASSRSDQNRLSAQHWMESERLFRESLSLASVAAKEAENLDPGSRELESLRAAFGSIEGDQELARQYAQRIANLAPDDPIVERVRARDRQQAMDQARDAARAGDREGLEQVWDEYSNIWPLDPVQEFYEAEALSMLETAASQAALEPVEVIPPDSFEDPLASVKFRLIPAGAFRRGCTEGDFNCFDDEKPSLSIRITSPFYIAESETTNAQYLRCVEQGVCSDSTSQKWLRERGRVSHPVTDVRWTDARTFCEWIGGRLPTEAEWEYSARAGAPANRFPWGNEIDHTRTNFSGTEERDQWLGSSPAGSFSPNDYGLFDMSGNVREWVADFYSGDFYRKGSRVDPTGPTSGGFRVIRGGSWYDDPMLLRVSFRYKRQPKFTREWLGFRCVSDDLHASN